MFKKSQGGEWELPDEGSYIMRFTGIVPGTRTEHQPKKPGDSVSYTQQFQFVIDDDRSDWDGVEVRSWFNEYYSDKSKTGQLFCAILGVKELPDNIEEEDLFDKPFQAMIKHKTSAKNGNIYPNIESPVAIRPRGSGRRRNQQVQMEPDDAGEDEPPF